MSTGPAETVEVVDRMLDEADALAHVLDDAAGAAYAAQIRGQTRLFRADPQEVELLGWAADEHRRLGDTPALAYDLAVPGTAKTVAGQREVEVAHLVARGLTNKQIAAALVISQRTAEAHVEHILTKLGFTSRTQIAAWVIRREAGQRPAT